MASPRPAIDRGKIQDKIGTRPQPTMPDWFKPGATRPAPPGDAGARPTRPAPGDGKPPVAKPPEGGRPPAVRPPGPGGRPPISTLPTRPTRPWHPGHPNHRPPQHWWKWATAGAITGWVVHKWANPKYYRYGSGGTVYYENNVVYVDGQEYGSAEQYYEQTAELAGSAPDEPAEDTAWMPMGVFALTKEGVNASSMYLQLAVDKQGVVAGTFYNESTGATHPVEGMVDEKTQRVAWRAADGTNENVVMETGLYNLSEDQTPVLIHFGPEETQEALLVRLDEQEAPEPDE